MTGQASPVKAYASILGISGIVLSRRGIFSPIVKAAMIIYSSILVPLLVGCIFLSIQPTPILCSVGCPDYFRRKDALEKGSVSILQNSSGFSAANSARYLFMACHARMYAFFRFTCSDDRHMPFRATYFVNSEV